MKAILVKSDDWQGMFIDGKLDYEGHDISFAELKEVCKRNKLNVHDIEEKWVTEDYYDSYLSIYGSFPNSLSKVELQD